MNYNLISELGRGGFGSVWKAVKNGKVIALKIVELKNESAKNTALKEVEKLKEVSQKCIPALVCFYDSKILGDKLYLEMEYIRGNTLTKFAADYRNTDAYNQLYKNLIAITIDIIPAIQYLHSFGIIHRDIKPDNIMIDNTIPYKVQPKLIDIGLACSVYADEGWKTLALEKINIKSVTKCTVEGREKSCCTGSAGTPYYMAPETLIHNIAYYESDIWSLGATLYFCATGKDVFIPIPETIAQLRKLVLTEDVPILGTPNIVFNSLVSRMLEKNVNKRITSKGILQYLTTK